jgi:hypothetical protein
LTVTGCGSASSSDLRDYLRDEWSFDSQYGGINEDEIAVEDGAVTVGGTERLTETSAMRVCDWVAEWVYGQGNGEDDWTITVSDEEGRIMSSREHENDVCSFGDQ